MIGLITTTARQWMSSSMVPIVVARTTADGVFASALHAEQLACFGDSARDPCRRVRLSAARLGDDKVGVVGRLSNLRRASAYSGLLREGIRGLHDRNSLPPLSQNASAAASLASIKHVLVILHVPRSVTAPAYRMHMYVYVCSTTTYIHMYVPTDMNETSLSSPSP